MKVLVLGASGLLGNTVYRILSDCHELQVAGTIRSSEIVHLFGSKYATGLMETPNLARERSLEEVLERAQPDLVVNCVSVSRPPNGSVDEEQMKDIYDRFPHRLARICGRTGSRLLQISSDGVFSGERGFYTEDDPPDARDAYGISKLRGEIGHPHLTIRTSMIGHEILHPHGLLEWFLRQSESCRCYTKAFFSGLPTVELARLIRDFIIPRSELSGVYHVAASPVSKFNLLSLVADVYGKKIAIVPDARISINRSLVAAKFNTITGYVPPEWRQLIKNMYLDHQEWENSIVRG